jgi:L-2-hydroxycarboxylate dehydrogenase (NAD+)
MTKITYFVVPAPIHDRVIDAAFRHHGFSQDESALAAKFCSLASLHGIHTHNGIKALHLHENFGKFGGCVPKAAIEKLPSKYKAVQRWNANRKLGIAVAAEAMETCMKLADEFGVGIVAVDNAFHYLWGGGYVIDAADRGYIAYTNCTAASAEVVPHGGKSPTLGTNPHSWGFPTREILGYPICIDWATSVIAMGRVQQFVREKRSLPPGCAVDADGKETTDPTKVAALIPFGAHKGYGLALIDELIAAYTGGSIPTIRSRWKSGPTDDKRTPCFFFQCIRPDAIGCDDFAFGRSQSDNVKAVIADILGHGNEKCLLPGQIEAEAAAMSKKSGGLLFTQAEINELSAMASEAGISFESSTFKKIEI